VTDKDSNASPIRVSSGQLSAFVRSQLITAFFFYLFVFFRLSQQSEYYVISKHSQHD